MQSTNIPAKIPVPFANSAGSGFKNTIPLASQIGITNGAASLTDGFPPLTFQALSAGGTPPFGADFNGILNEITAIQQWQTAGGAFPYDSAFSTIIGGYPAGAVVISSNPNVWWLSTVNNNTDNPDTGGSTGWVPLYSYGKPTLTVTNGTQTLTLQQVAYPVITLVGTLTANAIVNFPIVNKSWIIQNLTTGSYTLTVKTASGTGVLVPQGNSSYVFCEGANILFADGSKVASFNGRIGTVTLNATDVTDALGYIPVNPNQFGNSLVQNGYQRLPGGLIMQWQTAGFSTGGILNNFPIAFPNGHLASAGIDGVGNSAGLALGGIQVISTTQFYGYNNFASYSENQFVISFGY